MAAFRFKFERPNTNSMQHKIIIIETLIFLLPLLAILYIIYRGNYYFDLLQVIMFMVIAFFVLVGMIIIRQILTKISIIATSLKKGEPINAIPLDLQKDVAEFHEITVSLNTLTQKLEQVTGELTQKSLELSAIKDLTEVITGNLSIDDQLNILLEKCMAITRAQIGSVLTVEPETRHKYIAAKSTPIVASDLYRFRICAAIGHGEEVKKGDLINIEKSVVRAALLEKGPLLIRDISKDPRTSKPNDPKYGAPSFLSMPIIVGDAVSAILNLAHKEKDQVFDENDENILSVLLRDIGFTLENATLKSRIREQLERIKRHHVVLEKEIEKRNRTELMLKYSNMAELRKAEETLAESEKKYRFITEKMTDVVWVQDMNLRTVYVSPSIETVLGFSPEERMSQDVREQLTPESMSVVLDVMAKELALEQQGQADPDRKIVIELEYYHKYGSTRWLENIVSGIRDDQGVLTGLHGVSRDITQRKKAEQSLRRAEENFRRSLDESPMGVRIVTIEGETLYANRAILDIYGYDSVEELMAIPVKNRYTPQSYAEFEARLEKRKMGDREPSEYEISIVRKSGEIRRLLAFRKEVIWDGERQFQLLYQDITKHKQAEQELQNTRDQLLQAEKLAAIGQLSAGVAHEILNPVNIISMELQLLQAAENLPPAVLEELKVCSDQIDRIVNIAKDLKQMSRISEKKIVIADINDTIDHVLKLYAAQLKIEGIKTIVQYQPDLPEIAMDKEKMEQVIMNLISNAASAMEGKEKKELHITTERDTVTEHGDCLKITVADTGTGIKSEHMFKIFNPFFTTKGQGKGTGLGLAISYSIVNDHGGRISAMNNEWGGATFYVTLPILTDIGTDRG